MTNLCMFLCFRADLRCVHVCVLHKYVNTPAVIHENGTFQLTSGVTHTYTLSWSGQFN